MPEHSAKNPKSHRKPVFWLLVFSLLLALIAGIHLFQIADLWRSNLSGLFYLEHQQLSVLAFLIPALAAFCPLSLRAVPAGSSRKAMSMVLLVMILSFFFPWKEDPSGVQTLFNDIHVWLELAGVLSWSLFMMAPLYASFFPALTWQGVRKRKTAAGELLILLISIVLCALASHICGLAQVFFLLASSFWLLLSL